MTALMTAKTSSGARRQPPGVRPLPTRRRGVYRVVAELAALGLTGMGLAGTALAGMASAHPVSIVWSTYLRTGPGSGYPVLDEIQHDTRVDLRTCGAHWCQIVSGRTVGYVDRDSLKLPRLPTGGAAVGGSQGCFVAGQYAWRSPAMTRFCETKPPR